MPLEKFKLLVHYVVARCGDPARLGATKLNKILWYCDTFAYRAFGAPITDETYMKQPKGPVPRHLLRMVRELEEEGKILVRMTQRFNYPFREFISLVDADSSAFSQREIEVIGDVMTAICDGHTATSISDLTHDQIWEAANIGEDIPLYATLAGEAGEITDEVTAWADNIIKEAEARRAA